jgi:hypothetical protein
MTTIKIRHHNEFMDRAYLPMDTPIQVNRHQRGELGQTSNWSAMTVSGANKTGEFDTTRGTMTVWVRLSDVAAFNATHGLALDHGDVSVDQNGPYVLTAR